MQTKDGFKLWITAVKTIKSIATLVTVVAVAIQTVPIPDDVDVGWWPYLIAVGGAILRGLYNVLKHRNEPGNPLYYIDLKWIDSAMKFAQAIGLCLLLGIMLGGCAHYGYQFTDADGTHMEMQANSLVSKIDQSAAQANYKWGADGSGHWVVGGSATGMDSTEALDTIKALLSIVQAIQAMQAISPTPDPVGASTSLSLEQPTVEWLGVTGWFLRQRTLTSHRSRTSRQTAPVGAGLSG